jgi:metallo-beta-lactamase family protein
VLFVGYQAHGTLGRRLVEGDKNLRIAGEDITVNASLHTLGGFSAHGDRDDLLGWASHFRQGASFFVTHGESSSAAALAAGIREMGYSAAVPTAGAVYGLSAKEPAIARPVSQASKPATTGRDAAMALLAEIASETASIMENLDARDDYAAISPLLESSRLILHSVKAIRQEN